MSSPNELTFEPCKDRDVTIDFVWKVQVGECLGTKSKKTIGRLLFPQHESKAHDNERDKSEIELSNLFECLKHVCGLVTDMQRTGLLTVQQLCDVHKILTRNTDCNKCGTFRNSRVFTNLPDGDVHFYPEPTAIGDTMYLIVDEYNRAISRFISDSKETSHDTCENITQIAADLFADFINLHPFVDGNGRTARMLSTYAMFTVYNVPIQPFLRQTNETEASENRKQYMDAIVASRTTDVRNKKHLKRHFLEDILNSKKDEMQRRHM